MEESRRKDPKEKKCAICGKDIYAGEEWAYKRREKSERTKWFCSYKCMRAWDAKHGPKQKKIQVDTEATAPKEPVSREVLARALVKEIKNGGSVIAYMKAEGYKNPWEAYNAVRHYAQTKMPELAEVLKPLKDLPKAPQAKTGRPKKQPAEVETVKQVPPVLQAPVTCIQHVTPVEIQEAAMVPLTLSGGVDYQLKVDEAMQAEAKEKKPGFRYAIKTIETSIGEFSYDRKANLLIFRRKDEEKEFGYQYLSMSTAEWDKMLIIVPQLADLMGVTL